VSVFGPERDRRPVAGSTVNSIPFPLGGGACAPNSPILDALSDCGLEEVWRRYPVLSYNDIRAALAFASEVLKAEFGYEEEGQETCPKSDGQRPVRSRRSNHAMAAPERVKMQQKRSLFAASRHLTSLTCAAGMR